MNPLAYERLGQFEREDDRESFECIAWKDGSVSFHLTGDSAQAHHQWDLSPADVRELLALLTATVKAEAGEGATSEARRMVLMPPRKGLCPECATAHAPEDAHNRESLYYQMAFHQQHGRWPTWDDALAHCDPATQAIWREELQRIADGSE